MYYDCFPNPKPFQINFLVKAVDLHLSQLVNPQSLGGTTPQRVPPTPSSNGKGLAEQTQKKSVEKMVWYKGH